MELKRILARDSRAANDKALQLYGPDVLVISSQRVDNQTELIVAIDTQEDALAGAPQTLHPVAPLPEHERFVAFSEVFKASIESPEPPAAEVLGVADVPAPEADHEWLQSEPTVREKHQADADDLRRSRDTVELLRQEIAALRQEFNLNRQVAMWQSGQGLSAELTGWFSHMQELGVPASLRTLMADAVHDCETVSEALPKVHQGLMEAIKRRKSAWPTSGVHALVGPSGAGKSLMIARMVQAATNRMPAEEMAVISFADTKAGAWSQMQVLAAQSGVRCYRAADVATLELLLCELSHHKTLWIDTPGTDFLWQATALQALGFPITLHAVLPLDATVTNVRKIFDSSELTWKSVMLTKLDEAAHPWHVVKALCDHALPVAAVGGSQLASVAPLAFDAAALVDLALSGLQPQGSPIGMPAKKPRRRTTSTKPKVLNG